MVMMVRRAYDWMGKKAHSPFVTLWIAFFFFIEASIFFIPVDPLLILCCVENNRRSWFYATIATAASVIGGIAGYLIGYLLWDSVGLTIVDWFISKATFDSVVAKYELYQAWAVLVAGFTPIPYKAVTISAGFCKLPFIPFVMYSIIARGARFFLVAGLIRVWGDAIRQLIDRYFTYLVVAFFAIVVLSCSVLKGSNDILQLNLPYLKQIEALAKSQPGCISFSQGSLLIGEVDQAVKDFAKQVLDSKVADYYQPTLGIAPLREKLASKLSAQQGIELKAENIAVTHGAVSGLLALSLLMLKEGDEVILLEPSYPAYTSHVALAKGRAVFCQPYSLTFDGQGNKTWTFDVSIVEKAITNRTKMILFSNPSNPIGATLSEQDLAALVAHAIPKGIYLVVDEIYDDYVFEGTFHSVMPYLEKSDHVIRVGSFSKNLSMSGWRIGYVAAQPSIIKLLEPAIAGLLGCAQGLSQHVLLYALDYQDKIVERYKQKLAQSRDIICSFLDDLQKEGLIEYVRPNAGFYVFIKTKEENSLNLVMDILKKANVSLVPGVDFGPDMASYIRLCFAREPEIIKMGIERLRGYFSNSLQT